MNFTTSPLFKYADSGEVIAPTLWLKEPCKGAQQCAYQKFDQTLNKMIEHVNDAQIDANNKMESLEAGEDNLIETVIAIQKANQTMNMMIQVRNALVDDYHEVFNIPM